MTIDKMVLFVLGFPIWVVIRVIVNVINWKKKVKVNFVKEILLCIFIIYLFSIVGFTLFPIYIHGYSRLDFSFFHINYIPLVSTIRLIGNRPFSNLFQAKLVLKNLGGNILLLLPLSLMLPIIWNKFKKFKYCFWFGVLISFLIETMQFIENIFGIGIGRVTDIDDLILNSLGIVIGGLIFKYIVSRFNTAHRNQIVS